jgi:tetratricopeptide (TPR) repeat protein
MVLGVRRPKGTGVALAVAFIMSSLAGDALAAAGADEHGMADSATTRSSTVEPAAAPGTGSSARVPSAQGVDRAACDHIRYAIDLAGRGAICSASAELVETLNSIALALDADQPSPVHRTALEAGLRAVREAEDFAPNGVRVDSQVNLSRVVTIHRTPVLKGRDVDRLTQMDALDSYYAYAAEQLAFAGGHERTASMALYGCGRMELVATAVATHNNALAAPKAIAWQRAALLVDSENYLAANELGVLLGRCEQWQEAKSLLVHSVSLAPTPEGWHNLALTYAKLGEQQHAQDAQKAYLASLAALPASAQAPGGANRAAKLRWVEPAVFIRDSGPDQLGSSAANADRSKQAPSTPIASQPAKAPLSQISSWLSSKLGDTGNAADSKP